METDFHVRKIRDASNFSVGFRLGEKKVFLGWVGLFTNQGEAVIYGNWAEVIDELGSHCSFVVKDTETEELIEVYKQNDRWTICPAGSPTSEAQKPVGWARSLDDFMGIVSSPYGDKASNCYRFELIE